MAKIRYNTNDTNGFSGGADVSINGARTKAVIAYEEGAEIVLFGGGLKGRADGTFKEGTVEKIVFVNSDGDNSIVVNGDYDAAKIAGDSIDVESLFYSLFDGSDDIVGSTKADSNLAGGKGKDTIDGREGSDVLVGGAGNDVLTGGGGADGFSFHVDHGVGHDVITDFHTAGSNHDALMLNGLMVDTVSKANGGNDTLLTLDNGGTILLEDVTKADFLDYWVS